MTVELICVGTELLLGNIVNTNAAYLSEKCAGLGLFCYHQSVVGDNEERLTRAIEIAMERSDVVILCGGLGPTEDDLTKEVAAKVCGLELEMDERSRERIAGYFKGIKKAPTENNWKQAMIPVGAIVLDNDNGTAPGVIIETENNSVILLPGPPGELIPLFEDKVAPYLEKLTPLIIRSQTVKICGVGESRVETMVKDLIDTQSNPTIATYAKIGDVHVRVTASAETEETAKALIRPMVEELKSRFGHSVYTTEEGVTLEMAVAQMLLDRRWSITCAESCTGGMLSARLVNVPGVSECYNAGFTTYSNEAKQKLLGVQADTLDKYGAVSEETAREMARGTAQVAGSQVAVAITGIAGPGGAVLALDGSVEKPVGLVYIACDVKGKTTVNKYQFKGNRSKIRESAVSAALALVRNCILEAQE